MFGYSTWHDRLLRYIDGRQSGRGRPGRNYLDEIMMSDRVRNFNFGRLTEIVGDYSSHKSPGVQLEDHLLLVCHN